MKTNRQANNENIEISIVLPSLNEGDNVAKLLDEMISQLNEIGRAWEIIAIDSPSKNSSYATFKAYAEKYPNITAIELAYKRIAGSGKTVQYMIGFALAKGKYIIQMDSDYQDDPADLPKFLEKLDAGYELVVGHKQNRKDAAFYMLTSKIANTITRWVTEVNVHDMNCGFKGYQNYVAKNLNLRGRLYRYIPAICAARGYKITEVPINNRKRVWGSTNFSFLNRLKGGFFDLATVIVLNKMGDTPMYFFGLISLIALAVAGFGAYLALWTTIIETKLVLWNVVIVSCMVAIFSYITGISVEYGRFNSREKIKDYGIKEMYSQKRGEVTEIS